MENLNGQSNLNTQLKAQYSNLLKVSFRFLLFVIF